MCRPLDPLFSPQAHPLVGSSNVKHTLVGYHFFVLSHSHWVIFVKFSNLTTLFGLFLWKFDTPVGVKIHSADTQDGVKIHPAYPSPLPVLGPSARILVIWHWYYPMNFMLNFHAEISFHSRIWQMGCSHYTKMKGYLESSSCNDHQVIS